MIDRLHLDSPLVQLALHAGLHFVFPLAIPVALALEVAYNLHWRHRG